MSERIRTKVGFKTQLPATPCTPEMREKIIALAKKRHKSVAEIQREALSLFLASSVS